MRCEYGNIKITSLNTEKNMTSYGTVSNNITLGLTMFDQIRNPNEIFDEIFETLFKEKFNGITKEMIEKEFPEYFLG
jgi:hypothetical protein